MEMEEDKPDSVKKVPPSLEDFRAQIEHYEQLFEEVNADNDTEQVIDLSCLSVLDAEAIVK